MMTREWKDVMSWNAEDFIREMTLEEKIGLLSGVVSMDIASVEQLGIDMSSAVNMFLKQSVLRGGLPFSVELPRYKTEVIDAMEEARKMSKDSTVKRYKNFAEAMEDLFDM